MGSDGRIEKRETLRVPVHMAPMESAFNMETATTVNISLHGARILTNRRWRPGDQLSLTSSSGEYRLQGKVIYCYQMIEGQFCVGVEFDVSIKNWRDVIWVDVA